MKKFAAEFVGTFTLVLFGCGAAVIAGKDVGVLGIAFAFGFALIRCFLKLEMTTSKLKCRWLPGKRSWEQRSRCRRWMVRSKLKFLQEVGTVSGCGSAVADFGAGTAPGAISTSNSM